MDSIPVVFSLPIKSNKRACSFSSGVFAFLIAIFSARVPMLQHFATMQASTNRRGSPSSHTSSPATMISVHVLNSILPSRKRGTAAAQTEGGAFAPPLAPCQRNRGRFLVLLVHG